LFTGIIEDLALVEDLQAKPESLRLEVLTALDAESLAPGDSIAVNGVCLTVTGIESDHLVFDVSHETVASSTLRELKRGDRIHLERALSLGGRLGGHLVTGHVDGVGEVVRRVQRGDNLDLFFRVPQAVEPYLVDKGSVAVDGVSLTINQPQGSTFRTTLIPHTLGMTTLGELRAGDRVNLEADIIGKYVRHFTGGSGSGIDEEFLSRHGFIS